MIGFLKGTVELLDRPFVLIDVNGVGYRVLVSGNVLSKLTKGDKVTIFTFTYVREDALELFGFAEIEDLKLFESLISVSGIGPRTALNIFSFGSRDEIIEAIVRADASFFTSVPRLGTKNAQRIIVDLKNKMGAGDSVDLSGKDLLENAEAVEALKSFGFSAGEAQKVVREIKAPGITLDEKIKLALKNLGKR
ncbi:MAG: Holliday junction branch migration protein RuvA [Candidatus Levyibacteriota bacterium]